jgi:hypothetical protein
VCVCVCVCLFFKAVFFSNRSALFHRKHTVCSYDICQSNVEGRTLNIALLLIRSPSPHFVCFILSIFIQEIKPPMVSNLCLSRQGTVGEGEFLPLGDLQELHVPLPPLLARPAMKTTAAAIFRDLAYSCFPLSSLVCPEGLLIGLTMRVSSRIRLHKRGSHCQRQKLLTPFLN